MAECFGGPPCDGRQDERKPDHLAEPYPMPLSQPDQNLKRDLQGIASDLKWSAVELKRIAERLSQSGHEADAQAVLKMCTVFHAGEDRLAGYAVEIVSGKIVREI